MSRQKLKQDETSQINLRIEISQKQELKKVNLVIGFVFTFA